MQISFAQTASNFQDWITSILIDSSGTVYAGTSMNGNGIFLSSDGGNHWQQTKMKYGVMSMTMTKSGSILSFAYGHSFGRYLFRLKNNGSELDSIALTFSPAKIVSSNSGTLYATTFTEGLFVSTDDGTQWSKVNSTLDQGSLFQAITVVNDVILIASRLGISRSTDQGQHWTRSNGIQDSTSVKHIIAHSNGKIYAGGYESMMLRANVLFGSSDTGRTWKVQGSLPYALDAVASDSNGNIYVGNTRGIYRMKPNGDTINLGLGNASVNNIGVRSILTVTNTTIFAGVWGGIYRSVNGGLSWEFFNDGFISDSLTGNFTNSVPFGAHINCGVITKSGTIIVGTDSAGVFYSNDQGKTWIQSTLTVPNINGLTIDSLGTIFAGSLSNGIYHSNNNGETWDITGNEIVKYYKVFTLTSVKTKIPKFGIDSLNMRTEHIIHAGTNSGVYYRYDTPFFMWNPSGIINDTVLALATLPSTGDVFASTVNGTIFLNVAGWTEWKQKGSIGSRVNAMACDTLGVLYTVGLNGVNRSADKGLTWQKKNSGIVDTNLISVVVTPTGEVFVGSFSKGDIYKSIDQGEHWEKIATLSYPVRSLILDAKDHIYASTAGRFFQYKLTPTSVIASDGIQLDHFELKQNYPNPFNPSTVISYQLSMNNHVSLKIYDAIGREVADLVNEEQSAGGHSVMFNASHLSSGTYFYHLRSGNFSSVKKMLLLK